MDVILYEKPLKIEFTGYLLFVNGNQHQKSVRSVPLMLKTLMNRPELESLETLDMYFMYRNVLKKDGMRYDITMIPPVAVAGEAPKTHGHYHPKSEDGLAYPEVYQVLNGKAVFILQKKNRNGTVDAIMVKAEEGDVVLLPPGYGHVTVNQGDEALVLSNMTYDRFEPMYDDYDENQGAAYYIMEDGTIEQNGNYIVRVGERLSAKELNARYGFSCKDILKEVDETPEKFTFLEKPKLLFKA
jgi:glucose-6-phosphate isomerase